MAALLNDKADELIEAGALFAGGFLPLTEATTHSTQSESRFLAELEDPETLARIEKRLVQMKLSGEATEKRAAGLVDQLVNSLAPQIGDMSALTAIRVGEFLLKVAGTAERRAAEIKKAAPDAGTGFSIIFNMPGSPGYTHSVKKGVIIDAEVVEVNHD